MPLGSRSPLPAAHEEQDHFRERLSTATGRFFTEQRSVLDRVSSDAVGLVDSIEDLTSGGKKLRPLLCYWGWRAAGGAADDPSVVTAGMALELFQAAALIHDDIIDRSDIRRGAPSVHKQFETRHRRQEWRLDPERFGAGAAILAGDLCLSFSEAAFASAAAASPGGSGGPARAIFNLMRTEVMAGQYLDLLEEAVGADREATAAVERALTIVRFKSAKYSTEHPMGIGGALAGAPKELLEQYSDFSLPLGEAFQLRDDLLGVFGDPSVTGKPAGDDLREGKRTLLIAKANLAGSPSQRQVLDADLGRPGMNDGDVAHLRSILEETGARDHVETLIEERAHAAFEALERLDIDPLCRGALAGLATAAITRAA